jgi:hypothetical protein
MQSATLAGRSAARPPTRYHGAMVTKLEKPLKREILIEDKAYVLTISPEGLKLTLKGHRKGQELAWRDLVNGQAALATALNASLEETR